MDAGVSMSMNTLSRREEETLVKTAKAKAMRECDPIVKRASFFSCLPQVCGSLLSCVSLHLAEIFCFFLKSRNAEHLHWHDPVLRIRGLRAWPDALGCMGVQGQVQGRTGLYAIIVSTLHQLVCKDLSGPAHTSVGRAAQDRNRWRKCGKSTFDYDRSVLLLLARSHEHEFHTFRLRCSPL